MPYEAPIQSAHEWFTGTDTDLEFPIYAPTATKAEIEAGTAARQNVTGWEFSWMLKRSRADDDADAVLTKTTADGITTEDAANGDVTVSIENGDTAALPGRTYWHELKRVDLENKSVLGYGTAVLRQAVHRV